MKVFRFIPFLFTCVTQIDKQLPLMYRMNIKQKYKDGAEYRLQGIYYIALKFCVCFYTYIFEFGFIC